MSLPSSLPRAASVNTPSCAPSWTSTRFSRSLKSFVTRSSTKPRRAGGHGLSWHYGRWVPLLRGCLYSGAERKAMDVSEITGDHIAEPTVVVDDISVVYRTKNQTPGRTNARSSILTSLRNRRLGDKAVKTRALNKIS